MSVTTGMFSRRWGIGNRDQEVDMNSLRSFRGTCNGSDTSGHMKKLY